MTERASIIIPTHNGLGLLQRCVDAIRSHTPACELIVVDNASTDGTPAWCLEQRIPFIAMPRNEGFPAACNQGLRMAKEDTLVLLNNDTVVTANWLANLTRALYSAPDVGIVGPVTNDASGVQQVDCRFANLSEFQHQARRVNRSDPSCWQETMRIAGICMVFRQSLVDRVGLLDERFGLGHYEDDDYCFRVRAAGFRLLVCRDVLIYHEGSASFRQAGAGLKRALVERNYRLFLDKWHEDPRKFV